MKHYVLQKGVYVYERYLGDKSVLVIMNGQSKDVEISLDRYVESIKGKTSGNDILTNKQITLNDSLKLTSKQMFILEL